MTAPATDQEEMLLRMREQTERLAPEVDRLMAEDPQLKIWTAMTIAQDRESAKRALAMVDERGWLYASHLVGSYARLAFVMDLIEDCRIEQEEVYEHLPELWRGSDPDDTDVRFLRLWEDAWNFNGARTITDGEALPRGRLTIYRGQDEGAKIGIAWSLDEEVARKFAHGAATRQHDRQGVLYVAHTNRRNVLAYLTERGEFEVIVDPMYLR
jgi:hypothetical protein